jgi:hypothetical protein
MASLFSDGLDDEHYLSGDLGLCFTSRTRFLFSESLCALISNLRVAIACDLFNDGDSSLRSE